MEGKMHGYQLNEYVGHMMSFYTKLKKSVTYFTLEQLTKEGYVVYNVEREGKRPERRVYEITEQGKDYFYKILRECLCNYEPAYSHDYIGIAFMEKIESSEVKRLLNTKRMKIQTELEHLNETPAHPGSAKSILDHRLAYLNADLRWVNRILRNKSKKAGQ